MNLLRRLFGGGAAPSGDNAIHLYVRCNRCGAPVHVRIDPRNDGKLPQLPEDLKPVWRLVI